MQTKNLELLKEQIIQIYNEYSNDLEYSRLESECKGNFYEAESRFLYSILRHIKPSIVLEMSPNYGFTSKIILEALNKNDIESKLYSFDIHANSLEYDKKEGLIQRELIVGDGQKTLDDSFLEKADFFLIDSDHSYGFGKWYSEKIKKLKKGTLIMIHDWPMFESNGACDNIVPEYTQPFYKEYVWNLEVMAVKNFAIRKNIIYPILNVTDFLKETNKPYYYTHEGNIQYKALSPSQILIKL